MACDQEYFRSVPITLEDPYFLDLQVMQKEVPQLDFSYMTGGSCFWGSWILKTSALTPAYARNFASTDALECLPGQICPKSGSMGSSAYAPIYVLFNRTAKDGLFVGWDYLGRWASEVGNFSGAPVNVGLESDRVQKTPRAGALPSRLPKLFTGVFRGESG